ncbi:hypothetical protein OFY17_12805 [Marinomonas sp. C2222]|uniref:Uncharacterized protein n=1 Tax=Marinomonas sargassi TaxID=2984494 RepID=A0ABT2YV32_9GAMM|nr:hypothetical protein [Marinomonas sargassi]MCV2403746.1 hypothetical protein [Marinomonas sargassi]
MKRVVFMNNIYSDKWGLAYAAPLWCTGLLGMNHLIAGIFLLNTKLIIIGICATIAMLRKDILHFAKFDRLFLVGLIIQTILGVTLIGMGVTYDYYQLVLISGVLTLIWTTFIFFYYLNKLDWND